MRSTLHDPLLTPENRLWRAVLEQAYVDAESGFDYDAGDDDDGDGPPEQLRARGYLRGDSKPDAAALTLVCDFAEVPADRVLNWARRNYPRPKATANAPIQSALAAGHVGVRHSRARSCAAVSA
jgi:hypothetical protein